MEDTIVGLLLKNGAFGILAGVILWLYIQERRLTTEYTKHSMEQQVSETKAKVRLTHILEDLVETVEAVGENSRKDMGVCQSRVGELISDVRKVLEDEKLERAKEEGRREVTAKIRMPRGGEDEPR